MILSLVDVVIVSGLIQYTFWGLYLRLCIAWNTAYTAQSRSTTYSNDIRQSQMSIVDHAK